MYNGCLSLGARILSEAMERRVLEICNLRSGGLVEPGMEKGVEVLKSAVGMDMKMAMTVTDQAYIVRCLATTTRAVDDGRASDGQ